MVIERFRNGDARPVGERFKREGRMLPEGVAYHASWMEASGARCFQVMEASDREVLEAWMRHWEDLVEFDVLPVLSSADFWSRT